MSRVRHIVLMILMASVAVGCGGDPSLDPKGDSSNYSASGPGSGPGLPKPEDRTPWHDFLRSRHYSGYLSVMFKPGTGVRLRGGALISHELPAEVEDVTEVIQKHGGIVGRGLKTSEDVIERALERAEREGRKLHDWNLYYRIRIENPGHAELLYKELGESGLVSWVQPIPVPYLADVGEIPGGGTGNVLTQLYLDTHEATGGLNAYVAWDEGISGQGVRIADEEYNWNFDHEALPIDVGDIITKGGTFPFDINDPKCINHGTAVAGVLGAEDTGNGIRGMAYATAVEDGLKFFQTDISTDVPLLIMMDLLEDYVSGKKDKKPFVRRGDIILMEIQSPGPKTPYDTGCTVDFKTQKPTYCVPEEAYLVVFTAIEDITQLGVIVVEGAGNGGIDLGDPEALPKTCFDGPCPNLAEDDSGAIMVAASNGQKDLGRPFWSNWGVRVDAYAWGYDVVTTGYGDHPISTYSDPNKWYTKNFNGTSSAAALVAGAVALVQSFTKEYYKDIVPDKEVYLDAYQMRELIEAAGVAGDGSYKIGKKPDVGKMIELVKSGYVLPHVVPNNDVYQAKDLVVAGIRYDMDGDKRSELISFDSGVFKIDLSSVQPSIPTEDGYGKWDIVMTLLPLTFDPSPILFPVVHDYDSDGDADLALYDSKSGIWHVKFMTADILNTPVTELAWDLEIDYSVDPLWKAYSRPLVGDFNGDNYLDTALVRSDGHLLVDYGGIGHIEKVGSDIIYVSAFGGIEKDVKFLTDEQLAEAPGWAYLPTVLQFGGDVFQDFIYKSPDGVTDGEKIYTFEGPELNLYDVAEYHQYGGNETVMAVHDYKNVSWDLWFYTYEGSNDWWLTETYFYYFLKLPPPSWGGSALCYPVTGDYDGDGRSEFAMKCPDSWKIAYYNYKPGYPSQFTLSKERIIEIDNGILSLPPTIYAGGMRYQDIKAILEYYNLWDKYQDKDPFTPHTIQCIKYWAPPPTYCLAK